MNRIVEELDTLLAWTSTLFERIGAALFFTMLAINAANIVSRNLFGSAINWAWPLTMVLFVWWVLLAFFPLYRAKKDVSIYLILRRPRPRLRRALGIFVHLAILTVMAVLLYSGPDRFAAARGTIEIVNLPRSVLLIPLFTSAALIFLDAAVNLFLIATGRRVYKPFGEIEIAQ